MDLYADRSRALPVVDPQDRELIISCGVALGHLQVALRRFGYAGNVQTLPDPANRDLLARIRLGEIHIPDANDERLFQSLFARHTNRGSFHKQRVPVKMLATMQKIVTPYDVWLRVVAEGEKREALARLITKADADQLADSRFRWELSNWTRKRANQCPPPHDGIPWDSLGMPGLIADVGPFLVRTFDTAALFSARDRQLTINSPLLIVLGTTDDTPQFWLQTGQALSELLLITTAEGLAASFLNAPIEVAELRSRVCEQIGAAGHPQLILRLGYSEPAAPTPRRPLSEIIENTERDELQ